MFCLLANMHFYLEQNIRSYERRVAQTRAYLLMLLIVGETFEDVQYVDHAVSG